MVTSAPSAVAVRAVSPLPRRPKLPGPRPTDGPKEPKLLKLPKLLEGPKLPKLLKGPKLPEGQKSP